ncbi:organic cation transporter protein-like [Penaeus vannamei]|uniref:organic cation transporter protein-like n=1 Tax=Penaeus vannamei TaxID=6689 RepID=UPI00387F9097
MSKFDDLLKQLGTGVWNVFVVVAMCYCEYRSDTFRLNGVPQVTCPDIGAAFLTPDLAHTCRLPPDAATAASNDTRSQCSYNATTSSGSTEERPCLQWDFDNSTFTNTITSEFSLVCDRSYLRAAFKSVYYLAGFFGAMLNGWLSDRFGRKTMLSVGSGIFTLTSNILPWLPSINTMLFIRFVMGMMQPTSIHAGYTLVMEVNEPKYRAAAGISMFLPVALTVIALGGYGYLLRDWRWFGVTTSLPCLLFLPMLLFLDESPRWLIVRGRYDDALRILRKAARWNKAQLPSEEELRALMDLIRKEALTATTEGDAPPSGFVTSLRNIVDSIIVLVRTRRMRSITLSFYAQFFVLGMVYYGLSFGADKLGVDPFVYMAVSGVMEVPSSTLTIPLVEKMGRRASSTLFFVVTAGSLLVLGFIPDALEWLVITMVMLGRLAATVAFQVVYLYASELFPTEVRARGFGTCMMQSMVGAMLAPVILEMLEEQSNVLGDLHALTDSTLKVLRVARQHQYVSIY